MIYYIRKIAINFLFLYILNLCLLHYLKECNTSNYSRILKEQNGKKYIYYNIPKKKNHGIIKGGSKYNDHFFINNWKKKRNVKYKLNKYKPCSIFSFFKKKGKNDKNEKDDKNAKPHINDNNNLENKEKGEINKNKEQTSKEKIIILKDNKNVDEKKKKELQKGEKTNKLTNVLKEETKYKKKENNKNSNNHNNNNNNNMDDSLNKNKQNQLIKKDDLNNDVKNKKIHLNVNNIDTNSRDILKNENKYKKHLENVKDKFIISLNQIFCSYMNSIDKKENFKYFFEKILQNVEKNFHTYTFITDIEQMNNEKIKKTYMINNINCFNEIMNIIQENLYNILVFKIQFLKVKAINDIKEIIANKKHMNDYISYSNNINKIVQIYEEQLTKLCPLNYIFTLYNSFMENNNYLLNFSYELPLYKYKNIIDTNIEYLRTFSNDITKNKKKNLYNEIEKNKNYQSILQIIDNQQKQIEVLQEQLETSIDGINGKYSPFNCAVAYRIPDTNLNISTQYVKGKFNVKVNCIPDDSLHLLGSYGFVKGLPFGNLGLSLSLNF
ncbi:peripheral plastid protein 1, putative [Plasmodium sp. gorilla clade G2]|uniref:peripheral plastid protein 1, putative n=1 Tax=Plasmodium sp. gorilla clade G2 TaxID=880535 RepID=UPI000D215598|nr:peripheral plastid protein 1, putative [Plasmodium sp. gorilla clade G2]SOV16673.1 peripheral plastid protein 1, putative [Plasmodium sp. gorilla clade G2]